MAGLNELFCDKCNTLYPSCSRREHEAACETVQAVGVAGAKAKEAYKVYADAMREACDSLREISEGVAIDQASKDSDEAVRVGTLLAIAGDNVTSANNKAVAAAERAFSCRDMLHRTITSLNIAMSAAEADGRNAIEAHAKYKRDVEAARQAIRQIIPIPGPIPEPDV